MKAATKTQKPKRQEGHINFINWRFTLLCGCIPLALASLFGRVAWLQTTSPDMLVKEGDMRPLRVRQVPTSRGMITDRSGCPLVVSMPVKAIWVGPKEVHDAGGISVGDRWKALANALNTPPDQLSTRISASPEGRFIYLAYQINPDVAEYIEKLELPGIHLRKESRCYYLSGEVTAHLIGFASVGSQGIEGVEKSFDKWPTGQSNECIVRKDCYGCIIEDTPSTDSQAAHDLTLSIDEHLQALVYRELSDAIASNKAGSGSAVLMDANTDEVLVMANSPSYNPNNLSGTPKEAMRNRTITDAFEPGSMVKSMVVTTALQRGVMRENSVLNIVPYRINGHEIKDAARYSELALTGVLQKSNNVGVSKLALAIPSSALVDTYSRFGLGKATNLGLVGECSDLYPQKQRWFDMKRVTFSFGYGLMVTPLQLTRVCATIGSYGIYRPLPITKADPPVPGERVFPGSIIHTVVHMMRSVVLPGGGGVKAATEGYRIVTKTDTVKKVGSNGRHINKHIAYTAGVAPASQSRLALVVVINDPQVGKCYGGTVSTPILGIIVDGVLRITDTESDVLATGDKNGSVINQGGGTGGRS